ncbi:AraC family transcriptional regulator [Paenibacillus sp. MMS20-IR301]|uniref:AraC family transcriptional regulator n=1 Tax=Paenibacillus sp. MMS20-IR301 TaxID=2895946 RepID=UPI0028E21593|nr:AraC family transcriptional regulator [Paenibacillus sp. MMS20-IR301]WNS46297.1 AraC family transcriptional regulator [Paenibacillus sp. MMS20-IR301]
MDHYLLSLLKQTTAYMEEHLLDPLSLDEIAGQVNVSKFHLLRIWKGATATGLMEYVRRRRIAVSLGDLLHSRNTIEFISAKYSFGSERSYNRNFKEEYQTTPAKWRRNPSPVSILDRFNPGLLSYAGEGLVFFNSIRVLPSFAIAGHEFRIPVMENASTMEATQRGIHFFQHERTRIVNPQHKDVYIGFTSVPEPFDGSTVYQPSLLINAGSLVPPEMKIRHLRPHKYGVFTYIGLHRPEELSAAALQEIWRYIFEVWMPLAEIDIPETFSFEWVNYAKCSKSYCECDLYFPVSVLG